MKIAIYPGTFDPITNGHLDIVKRAAQLFDHIVVAVSNNIQKNSLFTIRERKNLVSETIQQFENVSADMFNGLLVHYAKSKGATALIRGIREVSDFEYEFQMALMNRKLMPDLETVYLMPSEEYTYINSTIVKEVARLGGNVDEFLPDKVVKALINKFKTIK